MNILIVDDHPLARLGLSAILSETDKIDNIYEASNCEEALNKLARNKIDIAFIDLKLGNEDGLNVAICGKEKNPQTRFIIITSFISHDEFIRAEKHDIDGYVLKEALPSDILFVFDSVIRGKKYYDPDIIMYQHKSSKHEMIMNQLTEREKEVLTEIGNGLSNDELSSKLFISENTVKKHISSILSKLNFKHRTQAALFVKSLY